MFESWTQEQHEAAKGALWREVRLRPGDLLYLPRGQYHYALADDGACAHIAVGVTYPIGMDVVSYGFERMVAEAVGRANLPRDRAALRARLGEIARAFSAAVTNEGAVDDLVRFMKGYRWPRETYDLPELVENAEERFRVKASGLRLVSQGGRYGLVKEGSRQAIEVPAAMQPQIAWVLQRDNFNRKDLTQAFPTETPARMDQLLVDLTRMAVIELEA
jgi:ribosomal protein L16 Arg81 hydroxylase